MLLRLVGFLDGEPAVARIVRDAPARRIARRHPDRRRAVYWRCVARMAQRATQCSVVSIEVQRAGEWQCRALLDRAGMHVLPAPL